MIDAFDYDAFISYSSADRQWVGTLVQNLSLFDLKFWWDQGQIELGESWVAALEKGLASSRKLVLIVSPASMASPRVRGFFPYVKARFEEFDAAPAIALLEAEAQARRVAWLLDGFDEVPARQCPASVGNHRRYSVRGEYSILLGIRETAVLLR